MSAQVDGGDLKRVESFQWPSGHVGHLTENQQAALEKFKVLCESKKYYHPGDGNIAPSHDDETLLRYLRARKFIPQDAFGQFKDTEDWRAANQLDTLYETIDIDEYEKTRRLYPQWTGRRDYRGIPLYVFEVSQVPTKVVTATEKDDVKPAKNAGQNTKTPAKMLRLFALYENLCNFVLPLTSAIPDRPNPETPISQSNNIVDISKVSLTKFWNLRTHMSDASTLATAHYPETLDRIFVVGAPSFFPTVWNWVKKWFDPITVSKIFILSEHETASTLAKYADLDNIPKKYGGNLDWTFGDMPFLDDEIVKALDWRNPVDYKGHKTFPTGPVRLEYGEKGEVLFRAIGSEKGAPRNKVIAGMSIDNGVALLSPGRVNPSDVRNGVPPSSTTSEKNVQESVTTSNMANSDPDFDVGKGEGAALPPSSRAGTFTVPYRDEKNDIAAPPLDARQGTSNTRLEQQDGTHAEGQLAHGTPAIKVDGQGTEHSLMEPGTVGQAPKEHNIPTAEEDAPSGMIQKAQNLANQAYTQAGALPATVMATVGLGNNDEKEPVVERDTTHDHAIDAMNTSNVEEYLRNETMNRPEKQATK